jgi:hypothetical protein
MMELLTKTIIVGFMVVVPATLQAQAPPHGYLFGGAAVATADGATDDAHRTYLEAPGGAAGEWVFGGGAFVASRLSVGLELRRTTRLEQIEPSRYFITYLAQRRDTILSFAARLHPRPHAFADLEPAVSFDLVREDSWLAQSTVLPATSADSMHFDAPVPFVNSWGRGIGVGADLRIGGGRLSVVPGFRFRRFFRDEEAGSTWPGGLSEWLTEAGASVRASF